MSDEFIDKQRRMVDLLMERTAQEKIAWKAIDFAPGFFATLGQLTVEISMEDGQYGPDVLIRIKKSDGTVIDEFADEDISDEGVEPSYGEYENYYELMKATYRAAQRKATGADMALDSVLNALEDYL